MAFSDFKYPEVLIDLGLTLTSVPNLFGAVAPLAPAVPLASGLPAFITLAASNTEMARMTWLVGPVLSDVWTRYGGRVSLHVGAAFTADAAANLSGYCDFLIGRYPQLPNVRPPAVVLVEAKQDNIFEGLGQCIAAMVGAQRFNRSAGIAVDAIYGVVTSGMLWRFLRLVGTDLSLDQVEYTIHTVDKILGILVHMVGPIPPCSDTCNPMIDLRSDTVTVPTPAMREAMFAAPVGDDVYSEDPTINALEEKVAAYLGKEAALFVPSGTMANQIAVRLHCRPGEELVCEATSHVILWEGGGPAALSGVTVRPLNGVNGLLSVEQLQSLHRPNDIHSPPTKLVWLENTHNRGGGTVHPYPSVEAISAWARGQKLALHLDGARLWNAVVASGIPARDWARHFDTVSVCFSKGLGAPVGSALAGPKELLTLARRYRKLFGGAMRQAGFLAAACIHAMDHHVERLAEDHANAKLLADAVRQVPGLKLVPETVETNLVWFEVDRAKFGSPQEVTRRLREAGVLMSALGETTVRACTHLNVNRAECEKAAAVLRGLR